jgi:hypothetical protein
MGGARALPRLGHVTATVNRKRWILLVTCLIAAVGAVAVIGGLAGAPSRDALLSALQRPAAPAITPAPAVTPVVHGQARVVLGGETYAVRLSPNRASGPNQLTVSTAPSPTPAAAVTVALSMPAMDMWRAYTLVLHSVAPGRYTGVIPFVGMPGTWRLDFRAARGGHATAFAVADLLGS